MTEALKKLPVDQAARSAFCDKWQCNFAVNANAGSGKTTAISLRLATMAMLPEAEKILPCTAVVTFTKKAAQQIGQRAREALLKKISEDPSAGSKSLRALNHLERAFFGTIHSFCLLLAKRYGHTLGINQNPDVVDDDGEAAYWEEFIEQDSMRFTSLPDVQLRQFLRHVPLEDIFELTRSLTASLAEHFAARKPAGPIPGPDMVVLLEIRNATTNRADSLEKLKRNQACAEEWLRRFQEDDKFLPFEEPEGTAGGMGDLFDRFYAPLKRWLASAGAALGAELAVRYRDWRLERGVQTYVDQVETAMTVLNDEAVLEEIRKDGWRVILDEAQDTDPEQFSVLVEITRAPKSKLHEWPMAESIPGKGPRAGHFCMVGDGQQAIYGSRADIGNFLRHIEAFRRGDGGELLSFQVTFRTPRVAIDFLNSGFPRAFADGNDFNYALTPEGTLTEKLKQVPYLPLQPGPSEIAGRAWRLPLHVDDKERNVDAWMAEEARQLAVYFKAHGPAGVGAEKWGDVCMIAPRNKWLITVRKAFEAAGVKVALQMRKNRNGDNPVYAWMTGLLAVVCDPANGFEWFGVLREVFAVSDAVLASEMIESPDGEKGWNWQNPEEHGDETLRGALETLRPFVQRANVGEEEILMLGEFAEELARACRIAEKARLLDPSGALEAELERLFAEAAALSLEGACPRDWLHHLRDGLDSGRPAGKPEDDAINLLTSHSSKGLEWNVVVPLGLWRKQGKMNESGLRLVGDSASDEIAPSDERGPRVYFDSSTMDPVLRDSRANEYNREQLRLLYVTLTRAKRHLVLPWGEGFGKKGQRGGGVPFMDIWGQTELVAALPECGSEGAAVALETAKPEMGPGVEFAEMTETASVTQGAALPDLPRRLLPHQLAHGAVDETRNAQLAREEDVPVDLRLPPSSEEAIEYGLWWHETMENLPWRANDHEIAVYFEKALEAAKERCGEEGAQRGREELERFRESDVLRELRETRWTREAELPIFAPGNAEGTAWIDGIIDLVIHDAETGDVRVLDWKTNKRRAGESDEVLLARLRDEYAPQLCAYGRCVETFFEGKRARLFVVSSAAGKVVEIARE